MSIRDALTTISSEKAKQFAEEYFALDARYPGVGRYTGAHFEALGEDQNRPNQITASDLLAVGTLSVNVPARAAIGILGDLAEAVSALLAQIPADARLGNLKGKDAFDSLLGPASPSLALWDLLRRNAKNEHRWDVGPTIASKILARKRPHLIPIEDSVVDRVIKRGRQNSWRLWWEALAADDALEKRASEVREHIGRPQLSTLRTLDIVLWKSGQPSSEKRGIHLSHNAWSEGRYRQGRECGSTSREPGLERGPVTPGGGTAFARGTWTRSR